MLQGSYDDISVFVVPLSRCPFNPLPPSVMSKAASSIQAISTSSAATAATEEPAADTAAEGDGSAEQAPADESASLEASTVDTKGESTDTVVGVAAAIAASSTSDAEAAAAATDDQEPALSTSLSPRQLQESSISPNLSIDSDMVLLDSLSARNMPSVKEGKGVSETVVGATSEIEQV